MDRGKAKMVEEEKEREEEEEALMDVDGDESKQGNEEIGVQNSNQSALDTMNSLQSSSPTRKGTATSQERKRKPSIPSCFRFCEKILKISSDKGERINLFQRRVPPSKDASSSKGNTENTASSATLAQNTASVPPPAEERIDLFRRRVPPSTYASSSEGNTENTAPLPSPPPQENQEQVAEEGNDHYLELVQSYVTVFSGKDTPPAEYEELLHRAHTYLDGRGNKINEELSVDFDCSAANVVLLKGPLGNFTINLQDRLSMLNVDRTLMVFMVKTLTAKDVNKRFKFPIYFAKKIAPLLTAEENIEEGVPVNVLDNGLNRWEVQLTGFNGNSWFLKKGWSAFKRNQNWMREIISVKIAGFRDFQSQELSFIVVPGD